MVPVAGSLVGGPHRSGLVVGGLRRYLSAVRRTGAAVGSQRSPRALVAAGVPIRDTATSVVAALSVVMPLGGADPRVIVPALQACARAITRDASR